jgi:hypothetical protein
VAEVALGSAEAEGSQRRIKTVRQRGEEDVARRERLAETGGKESDGLKETVVVTMGGRRELSLVEVRSQH